MHRGLSVPIICLFCSCFCFSGHSLSRHCEKKKIGPICQPSEGSYGESGIKFMISRALLMNKLIWLPDLPDLPIQLILTSRALSYNCFVLVFQAISLADIVKKFNWTYVSTKTSEGSYRESGINNSALSSRLSLWVTTLPILMLSIKVLWLFCSFFFRP